MAGNTTRKAGKMRFLIVGLVALFMAGFGLTATAGAEPYGDTGVTFEPQTPTAGGTTTVTMDGFDPSCDAEVSLDGSQVATTTADANGVVTAAIDVPGSQGATTHEVSVTCGDLTKVGSFTTAASPTQPGVTPAPAQPGVQPGAPTPADVGGATPTTSSDSLPKTGSNTGMLVMVGLGLAAMGAAIVVTVRRRRAIDRS